MGSTEIKLPFCFLPPNCKIPFLILGVPPNYKKPSLIPGFLAILRNYKRYFDFFPH